MPGVCLGDIILLKRFSHFRSFGGLHNHFNLLKITDNVLGLCLLSLYTMIKVLFLKLYIIFKAIRSTYSLATDSIFIILATTLLLSLGWRTIGSFHQVFAF